MDKSIFIKYKNETCKCENEITKCQCSNCLSWLKTKANINFIMKFIENNIIILYNSEIEQEIKMKDSFANFLLELIKQNSAKLSTKLKNNKKFLLKLTELDVSIFKYASNKLKNDEKFILELIKYNSDDINYISDSLKNDKNFILKAVELDGLVFSNINNLFLDSPLSFKDYKEIAIKAVNKNIIVLCYVSKKLRSNKKFVLEIMKINNAKEYTLEELNNSKPLNYEDITPSEIINNSPPLVGVYACEAGYKKSCKDIVFEMAEKYVWMIKTIPKKLIENDQFYFELSEINGDLLHFVKNELFVNEMLIKQILFGCLIKYI